MTEITACADPAQDERIYIEDEHPFLGLLKED